MLESNCCFTQIFMWHHVVHSLLSVHILNINAFIQYVASRCDGAKQMVKPWKIMEITNIVLSNAGSAEVTHYAAFRSGWRLQTQQARKARTRFVALTSPSPHCDACHQLNGDFTLVYIYTGLL